MASGILAAAATSQSLEAAHRHLLADPSLQFKFGEPQPPPEPPAWLQALAQILEALAPFLNVIFWGGVIAIAGVILYFIGLEILRRLPGAGKSGPAEAPKAKPEFRPNQVRAQALLEEADRLAREGKFNEAARVLLHRSINDIEDTFPNLIAP